MLQNDKPNHLLFVDDSLHMNKKGYDIWIKEIRKKIGKSRFIIFVQNLPNRFLFFIFIENIKQ